MGDVNNYNGGIGLAGGLTIVFVVLKLTGYISWSWWWVLSPIWISWGLFIAIFGVIGIIALILHLTEK